MKSYSTKILAVVCVLLAITFVVVKHRDNTRHEKDTNSITDYSNRLDTAFQTIAVRDVTILDQSNSLAECRSSSLTLSNQLTKAIVGKEDQITNLNRQIETITSDNQALNQQVVNLTNQITSLTQQIASTEASLTQTNQTLTQAHKDYALLENRFRIDVAERVLTERKFNNLAELQAQMEKLKTNPTVEITADKIYANLNVEVKSNGVFHVITPD